MSLPVPGAPGSVKVAKAQAKRLRAALTGSPFLKGDLAHSQALELVARTHGFESWGHLVAATPPEDLSSDDLMGHPHGLISAGYLFRFLLRVSGETPGSPIAQALLARMAQIIPSAYGDSEENRKVHGWLGSDRPLPWEATLVPTRGFRLISRTGSDAGDNGLLADLVTRGFEALERELTPNQNLMSRRALFFPTSELPGSWTDWVKIGEIPPAHKGDLLDRRHSLMKSFHLSGAMNSARLVDPDLLPLIGPGRGCEELLAHYGLSGVQMRLPGDALPWMSGLLGARALNSAPQAYLPASVPHLSVFLSASEIGESLEVLLAQARSLGIHLFVWPDDRVNERYVMERVLPNVGSVISSRTGGYLPRIARRGGNAPAL